MKISEKNLATVSVERSQAVCGSLLIFPINIDTSAAWVRTARTLGYRVIGASSESADPGIYDVDALEYLPYITSPEFNTSLQCLVSLEGVTRIYTAHQGVWAHLNHLLPSLFRSSPALESQLYRPQPHAVEYRDEIGTTVCVDPWGFARARDQGEKATILNGNGITFDFEGIYRNFLVSVSQVKILGYIRLSSEQGIEYYHQAAGALTGSISYITYRW